MITFLIWPLSQACLGGKGPLQIIQPNTLLKQVHWSRLSTAMASWAFSISTDGDFNIFMGNLCQHLSTLTVKQCSLVLGWNFICLVCVSCPLSSVPGRSRCSDLSDYRWFQNTQTNMSFIGSKLILSSPLSVNQKLVRHMCHVNCNYPFQAPPVFLFKVTFKPLCTRQVVQN